MKVTKVDIVIGRTGEMRIMDVKNDRLLITNNIPYGVNVDCERWPESQ